MWESRREAPRRRLIRCRSRAARVSMREEYLRARLFEPGRDCTSSDSRGAGMLRIDIYVCSRLTLVAGFQTPSERLLHPYAIRAQTEHERFCCQRPARPDCLPGSSTVERCAVNA